MIQYTLADRLIITGDSAIKTMFGKPLTTDRPMPGNELKNGVLTQADKIKSARLMRVNHAGEVAAQGLYKGQALTAKSAEVRQKMADAAREENDHLAWCQQRLHDLDSHTSILNPVWYGGSLVMGLLVGKIGDKWSLGFVAETEAQVAKHLDSHLAYLSPTDYKSRAVLLQMKIDECNHALAAIEAGGVALPLAVRQAMCLLAKTMTASAYWL